MNTVLDLALNSPEPLLDLAWTQIGNLSDMKLSFCGWYKDIFISYLTYVTLG